MYDTASFLILPLFSTIKLYFTAADVIHSFGINAFGIKLDVIPAQVNLATTIRPQIIGEYSGYCYELCGQGHTSMLIKAIVL
jgi:cytochrome c oxidase subunit 2